MVHFMGGTYLGTPFKHLPYYLLNTHSLLMVTIIATIEGTLSIWKVNHLKHQSTMQVFMYLLSKIHQNLIKTEQSYNISLWCFQHLRKDSFLKVYKIRHLFCSIIPPSCPVQPSQMTPARAGALSPLSSPFFGNLNSTMESEISIGHAIVLVAGLKSNFTSQHMEYTGILGLVLFSRQ
jgi:hypothetical protein